MNPAVHLMDVSDKASYYIEKKKNKGSQMGQNKKNKNTSCLTCLTRLTRLTCLTCQSIYVVRLLQLPESDEPCSDVTNPARSWFPEKSKKKNFD